MVSIVRAQGAKEALRKRRHDAEKQRQEGEFGG